MCWSHLETSSFTGLAPGVTVSPVRAALSISTFSQGLLPRLQLPHSMVASEESDFLRGSKSRCSSKQQNKSYVAFSDLTTEVMWCHFQSILLVVLIEAVTSLPIVKGKRHNHPPSQPHGRNVSEPLLYNTLLFNSQTIIF